MASCQPPTQPLLHSPSSTGQGEKIRWKSSRVTIKTGTSLTNYCHGQNRLGLVKIEFTFPKYCRRDGKGGLWSVPNSSPLLLLPPHTLPLLTAVRPRAAGQPLLRCPEHLLPASPPAWQLAGLFSPPLSPRSPCRATLYPFRFPLRHHQLGWWVRRWAWCGASCVRHGAAPDLSSQGPLQPPAYAQYVHSFPSCSLPAARAA